MRVIRSRLRSLRPKSTPPVRRRPARPAVSAAPGRVALAAVVACCVLLSGCNTATVTPRPDTTPARWPPPPEKSRYVYEATLRRNRDIEIADGEQRLKQLLVGDTRPNIGMIKPYDVAARSGRIYVSDTQLNLIHAFDVPRRRYFQFGYRREGALRNPLGISIGADERIYVADSAARRVVIYDPLGLYLGSVGSAEELDRPTAVTVSRDGQQIYVVDTGGIGSQRHRVAVYSPSGKLLRIIGRRGASPGEFNLPTDIAMDSDGTLYVLD